MASFTTRPVVMSARGVVTSGHYLVSSVGLQMLARGGNAIDAAAAMGICETLLEPQSCGIGGEVPTLVYSAKEGRTYAISGMGWSPQAFTIEWCRQNGIDLIPGDGYLPACVPAVVGTWTTALARWGTMSFAEIAQPTIDLAENGFPVYPSLNQRLAADVVKYTELYPTTGEIYFRDGSAPEVGSLVRNPDFGAMLRSLCNAEKQANGKGRIAGIEAACDEYYKGNVAETILRFIQDNPVEDASGMAHKGLLSYEDMAEWHAAVEQPVSLEYGDLDVHKCSSWTQGPLFLQQLAILKTMDFAASGHNSADYLHTWIESAKLAFADREAYYGDPEFDETPIDMLLSEDYAKARAAQIGAVASRELRPGDLGGGVPTYATIGVADDNRAALGVAAREVRDLGLGHAHIGDTTHLDAMDAEGNMVAATPSGGWLGTSPVIKGLGFPLGTRGQMFYLNSDRPNALQPRKRPRATLTPTLVTRDGQPFMAFGTPGGDSQEQWTLQFFLNHINFGMDLQEALDAPTVHSVHFPSSFYPRAAFPARVVAESRISADTLEELRRRGHEIELTGDWANGKVMGIRWHADKGVIAGAASAKNSIGYAMAL
ncbi:MAG: gamma-glutamyltransferase family protein [Chloroflexi bacterium]|nr:gamma-glutamyltransferase family protein [Chloroflexota bacterium]